MHGAPCARARGVSTVMCADASEDQTACSQTVISLGACHEDHGYTTTRAYTTTPTHRYSMSAVQRKGSGVVHVSPGCLAHPGPRTFWLGGVCKGLRA